MWSHRIFVLIKNCLSCDINLPKVNQFSLKYIQDIEWENPFLYNILLYNCYIASIVLPQLALWNIKYTSITKHFYSHLNVYWFKLLYLKVTHIHRLWSLMQKSKVWVPVSWLFLRIFMHYYLSLMTKKLDAEKYVKMTKFSFLCSRLYRYASNSELYRQRKGWP